MPLNIASMGRYNKWYAKAPFYPDSDRPGGYDKMRKAYIILPCFKMVPEKTLRGQNIGILLPRHAGVLSGSHALKPENLYSVYFLI